MGAKTSRGLQIKQHFRKNMVPDFGYNCKKRHFFHFFCPGAKLSGAKLSWCQIVHFYYLGAKFSAFIILVPNCPLYYLGAKLSGAKLSGAKLSGAKLSGAKLSYNPKNLTGHRMHVEGP